jgi:hypothetical protein
MLGEGKSVEEIARAMGIKEATTIQHRNRLGRLIRMHYKGVDLRKDPERGYKLVAEMQAPYAT